MYQKKMFLLLKLRRKIGTGTLLINAIFRYILRINSDFDWPVHHTSRISFGSKIKIIKSGSNVLIKCLNLSGGIYIQARNGVVIHDNVHLAPGVKIISANHDIKDKNRHVSEKAIVIESDVWIGSDAILLPGITIGKGAVVGAGAVVTSDIGVNEVWVGNPARKTAGSIR